MMMNSYQRNNRRAPFLGAVLGALAVCGILFVFDNATGGFLRGELRRVGGATLSSASAVSASIEASGFFSSRRTLESENEELRRELSLSLERLASFQLLQDENEALRALVGLASENAGVTSRIISSYRSTPYGTFMIDAGLREGVREGALILTEGGYVLGTVVASSDSSASARTVFAPGENVDLVVGDVAFSAMGRGGGNAIADVPREASLAVGDIVIAPAFGGRPAGLIGRIESASSSATQRLLLRIPVNINGIRFVHVVNR